MEIKRVVSFYEKEGDKLVHQIEIESNLDVLYTIFTPFEDDPALYMSYPIDIEKAQSLSVLYNLNLDSDHYDLYLECYAIE